MNGKEGVKKQDGRDIKLLQEYINSIKYGSITVNIQDGKIIQIDKVEKIRF